MKAPEFIATRPVELQNRDVLTFVFPDGWTRELSIIIDPYVFEGKPSVFFDVHGQEWRASIQSLWSVHIVGVVREHDAENAELIWPIEDTEGKIHVCVAACFKGQGHVDTR